MKNGAAPVGKTGTARAQSANITNTDIEPAPVPAQEFPVIIARFWKNRRRNEIIRVELTEYEQHKLVNVRIWTTGDDGIDRPSPKGIAMGIAKLPELAAALNKAEAKARSLGLIQDEGNQ